MTPLQFVDKWRPVALTERASAQEHFIDLCRLFDHPTPIEDDPTGERFTFEKGVHKAGGGEGFADVWKRGYFAWEYKKRRRNLDDALGQLSRYALALENPPLQVVCDTDRFRIVTAYTNSVPRSYDLSLEDLLDSRKRGWLEAAFHSPKKLQPGASRSDLTKEAANKFSTLTQRLQAKGLASEDVAHFVNRLVFLFFAEDVGLLKEGFFRRTVAELAGRPSDAQDLLTGLFRTFQTGGRFGLDRLPWINGGLFDDREALPLDEHEIGLLKAASSQDWAHIDPTIFGTLFERFLDPDKRAQIGAHYTDMGKIKQIIEPVILRPLGEEWRTARADIEVLIKKASAKGAKSKDWQRAEERRSAFLERLRMLSILDPACGSGNFLYLALHGVKDLEHAANQECEAMGLPPRMPMVGPEILRGIEINPLAAELARTTIWIGDIQWAMDNGIRSRPEPILRRLDMVECRDALLNTDGTEASWPDADAIIGNPPFLGDRKLIRELGEPYVLSLRKIFSSRVPGSADLVCYWFAKSHDQIVAKESTLCGLVSTNSIASGSGQQVLERITATAPIFNAWSDEPWVVDGAAVRVSIVCFGQRQTTPITLNGNVAQIINSDLTCRQFSTASAKPLVQNIGLSFVGVQKNGPFDVPGEVARRWLKAPLNPNGRPNSDVLRPAINGGSLVRNNPDRWLIDFGCDLPLKDAELYELPFEHVLKEVKPTREDVRRDWHRNHWWLHGDPRPSLRSALRQLNRYILTPMVSKHRVFAFVERGIMPENKSIAFATDSYSVFGVLQSRFHEVWSLALCTYMGVGNDPSYSPSRCFDTFPFPNGVLSPSSASVDTKVQAIATAAKSLDDRRRAWLTPADLIKKEKEVVTGYPDRMIPIDPVAAAMLKDRTFTKLYNKPPAWLIAATNSLDAAVAAAYGWPEDISTEDALARLLELNRERAAAQGKA